MDIIDGTGFWTIGNMGAPPPPPPPAAQNFGGGGGYLRESPTQAQWNLDVLEQARLRRQRLADDELIALDD